MLFARFAEKAAESRKKAMKKAREMPQVARANLQSLMRSIEESGPARGENGKMEIGKERAIRLAEALDVNYRIFL